VVIARVERVVTATRTHTTPLPKTHTNLPLDIHPSHLFTLVAAVLLKKKTRTTAYDLYVTTRGESVNNESVVVMTRV
jgi:hypothetical protein